MKDKLESIVADILGIPKDQVDSVITAKDDGSSEVTFFVAKPDEIQKEKCESGHMPPELRTALENDPEISKLIPKRESKLFICFSFHEEANVKIFFLLLTQ